MGFTGSPIRWKLFIDGAASSGAYYGARVPGNVQFLTEVHEDGATYLQWRVRNGPYERMRVSGPNGIDFDLVDAAIAAMHMSD